MLFLSWYLNLVISSAFNTLVSELSPTELRGPYGSFTQILITFGIMLAYFMGLVIPDKIKDDDHSFLVEGYWRILFGFPILLGIIQIILFLTIYNYDTPKHLK